MGALSARKFRKLVRSPGPFLRDYLNKRYPIVRTELGVSDDQTALLVEQDLALSRMQQPAFDIDVVFTWVNDADPAWQAKRNRTLAQYQPSALGRDAADAARFSNNDELRYSLHAVLAFMPWVRKVYIVTDAQQPPWPYPADKVQIVDHRDIVDACYLPTFNSHVIEAFLHRIPGLSEHFIYFNDDVFVGRPLPPGHFFQANGLASHFVSRKSLAAMRKRGLDTPTLQASTQSAALLQDTFATQIDTPLVHTYVPLRKDMYALVWRRYEAAIRAFLGNRFRGVSDLNLATFLVPWTTFLEGAGSIARDVCFYFNVRSPAARDHFRALLLRRANGGAPHSFCANDHRSASQAAWDWSAELRRTLAQYYGI